MLLFLASLSGCTDYGISEKTDPPQTDTGTPDTGTPDTGDPLPPGLSIAFVEPTPGAIFSLDASVMLRAQVTDDAARYANQHVTWSSSLAGSLGTALVDPTGATEWDAGVLVAGAHQLVALVSDPDGRSATDSTDILVQCVFDDLAADNTWILTQQGDRYEDFDNYVPALSDFPTTGIGTVADSSVLMDGNGYENSMLGLETWVLASADTQWDVSVSGDDCIGLWVDGNWIAGRANAEDPASVGSVTLGCGWHRVQVVLYNGPAHYNATVDPPPSAVFDRVRSSL